MSGFTCHILTCEGQRVALTVSGLSGDAAEPMTITCACEGCGRTISRRAYLVSETRDVANEAQMDGARAKLHRCSEVN